MSSFSSASLDIIHAAQKGGYALTALNVVNLETAQAALRAAEAERAPFILQVSQNAARYAGLGMMAAIGKELKAHASVPMILHFDHAETPDAALAAVEHGFDGVMLESDDAALLAPLAAQIHAAGAYLEAEYEVTEKGEREATHHDSVDDVVRFARESGCDLLAVALGSVHKQAEKSSRLDLARLGAFTAVTPLPLVLHGSSGVVEEDLAAAAGQGLVKVNIATELTTAFSKAVQDALNAGATDPRKALGAGRDAYEARARHVIRLIGGAGRAG